MLRPKGDKAGDSQSGRESRPASSISRREFIKAAGGVAAGLTVGPLSGCNSAPSKPGVVPEPRTPVALDADDSFRGHYARQWTWDSTVRGTHNVNCSLQESCAFDIYVKDGKVVREEQAGVYPRTNEHVPDFNPRGCQKGCTYSELMYSAPRVTRPLKRVGERGSGRWQEVSWDDALEDIAEKLIDAIVEDGPDTVVIDIGTNVVSEISFTVLRLADALDCVMLDMTSEVGDEQQGAAVTYGDNVGGRSADDYFYSDLVLVWGGNPACTQIPNYHFLTEARYNGTKVVSICPDLNATAIHADMWVPLAPGTDGALALAMAKVVIDEGLYDADLVREQTDLPFLVRTDTGRYLREADIEKGGSAETLYRYDLGKDRIEAADIASLALGGSVPALEGTFEVSTLDGTVEVWPVFELLKEHLGAYAPEAASEMCGVPAATIVKLARMLAEAETAANVSTTSISKFYHGDAMMRAQILAFVLCGHLGRRGSSYAVAPVVFADGWRAVIDDSRLIREVGWPWIRKHGLRFVADLVTGKDWYRTVNGLVGATCNEAKLYSSAILFWNIHGGVLDVSGRPWDPYLEREVKDYVEEALDKKWQLLEPAPPKQPRVLLSVAGNALRRVRGADRVREVLWPKLDLIVTFELRMSSTATQADYVLPAAGAYEKSDAMVIAFLQSPFLHTTNKAVSNVGDTKDEWEIACLLAKKIQERAKTRGLTTFTSRRGKERRLDKVYDQLTRNGELAEGDGDKLSELLVEGSTNLGGITWQELKEKGFAPFTGIGHHPAGYGQAGDINKGETVTPYTWHTRDKLPWPTLSGRVQFYIDHDWYFELGETLPTHKQPPKAGGDYPIVMTGGHTRWSIHAIWRADPLMLRLQRGEPCMWIAFEDARARGIDDGDRIEVFNDVGSFPTRARLSTAIRPGQAVMYHAWENYQFEGNMGYRNVMASPINPLELVGDYPFFEPSLSRRQPGGNDRDTRIDIRKA